MRGFGSDGVFRDKDSTSAGADFVHVIQRTIAMCDVLLVVIGPRWLQTRDGVSRLDDPRDWVRIEILSALERNILVIPILVDGATMPSEADLPEKLRPLARRQAVPLTSAFAVHRPAAAQACWTWVICAVVGVAVCRG